MALRLNSRKTSAPRGDCQREQPAVWGVTRLRDVRECGHEFRQPGPQYLDPNAEQEERGETRDNGRARGSHRLRQPTRPRVKPVDEKADESRGGERLDGEQDRAGG